jgi:ATP-dependent Lon protease
MNEIEFTDAQPEQVDELAPELPVLPLKETVVFPDSMAPLAIGQERSIGSSTTWSAATACSRWSPCVTPRSGRVPPIAGVREKVLAAQRAGLGRVILPRENEHDLDELPEETRATVAFVLVDSIEEVFVAAFGSNGRAHSNGRVQPATSRR